MADSFIKGGGGSEKEDSHGTSSPPLKTIKV